jgi:hypothetical protein
MVGKKRSDPRCPKLGERSEIPVCCCEPAAAGELWRAASRWRSHERESYENRSRGCGHGFRSSEAHDPTTHHRARHDLGAVSPHYPLTNATLSTVGSSLPERHLGDVIAGAEMAARASNHEHLDRLRALLYPSSADGTQLESPTASTRSATEATSFTA